MKLYKSCSGECPVCATRKSKCNPEDNKLIFTRANKDELINRLNTDIYTNKEKDAIKIWLKVQFDEDV